jgi:hypothetical protein
MPMLFRFTFLTLLLVAAAACNGGDDDAQSASGSQGPASLEEQLKIRSWADKYVLGSRIYLERK